MAKKKIAPIPGSRGAETIRRGTTVIADRDGNVLEEYRKKPGDMQPDEIKKHKESK